MFVACHRYSVSGRSRDECTGRLPEIMAMPVPSISVYVDTGRRRLPPLQPYALWLLLESLCVRIYRGSIEALPDADSAAGHVSSLSCASCELHAYSYIHNEPVKT